MNGFLKRLALGTTILVVAAFGSSTSALASGSEEDQSGIRKTVIRYERLTAKANPSVCRYMTAKAQEWARLGISELFAAYPPFPTCRSAYEAYRANLRDQGVLDEALSSEQTGFEFERYKVRGSFASVHATFDSNFEGEITEDGGKYHLRKVGGRWKFHRFSRPRN